MDLHDRINEHVTEDSGFVSKSKHSGDDENSQTSAHPFREINVEEKKIKRAQM